MKRYNKSNIPLAKTLRTNMTPWERNYGLIFCGIIPYVFSGKKPLIIILRISIAQKQGWSSNLMAEATIQRSKPKKTQSAQAMREPRVL